MKNFITTFAVQIGSYTEKLGEGRRKKTIKERLLRGCGKGEMAVRANCFEKLASDGLGLKQEFLCKLCRAEKLGNHSRSLKKEKKKTHNPQKIRQTDFTRSHPVVPPYSSLMFSTAHHATGPRASWTTRLPMGPPLVTDSQPGEQGYQQQPWGPF